MSHYTLPPEKLLGREYGDSKINKIPRLQLAPPTPCKHATHSVQSTSRVQQLVYQQLTPTKTNLTKASENVK